MIRENIEKEPFIHFGFNRQQINTYIGEEITIWQDSLYNSNYDYAMAFQGATIVSQSMGKFVISYNSLGNYNAMVVISDDNKTLIKNSNTITINVVERTFGASDIFWGNTEITFND